MPDFLTAPFQNTWNVTPLYVFVRLLMALLMGAVIGWIFDRTDRGGDRGMSFPTTLVLLCALVAMVTQVIGDNVARAFSLVGALSIVRFRTVVRDTRDTAFVIFSVVVGMAIGARNLVLAAIGLLVVGTAALIIARVTRERSEPPFLLRVRVGLGTEVEQLVGGAMDEYLLSRRLMSVNTARLGAALSVAYEGRMREGRTAEDLVRKLNAIQGVQDVRFQRYGFSLD
jgi:uncharacterized membrane protein YhiD involved in acid resistance